MFICVCYGEVCTEGVSIPCRFQALVSLLKAYSREGDAERTAEMLRLILSHKMVLPTSFVRDVCWRAGVSESVRYMRGECTF